MEQVSSAIALATGVFGGLIGLLIYIWNITQRANEKRHRDNEKRLEANEVLISKLTDMTVQQGNLLTKIDTMIEIHEKKLDKIER